MLSLFSTAFRRRLPLTVALCAALALPPLSPAAAQQRGISVVRDAEIEALVYDYARPVLEAAGLGRSGIEIILVNDPSFNAFVLGRRIFINTGALLLA
jgi:predicted Zn-dependent protease